MAEPYGIKLFNAGNFNGTTPIALTRADLTVDGQRLYTGGVPAGGGGIIDSDFFGLFAPQSPKLVGIAFSSFNPQSVARVIDRAGRTRQEVNLTGDFQYVLLHGRDRLAVLTSEPLIGQGTTLELSLTINELTEGDHMAWALAHPPAPVHTRLKIIRRQGSFVANNAGQWLPQFVWDPVSCVLSVTDNATNAPIPISTLSPFPRQFGSLLSIRYSGSVGDGKLFIVESETRRAWQAQTAIPEGRWSRVQYAAHDDLIMLEASPDPAGGPLVCDIELVRVEPGDRLRGRFFAPETNPVPGPGNNL
jgi:hypothetical protein